MKANFVCPYCFEKKPLSALEYRCDNLRCDDEDDLPMTRYEHGNEAMPKQGKHCFPVMMKAGKVIEEGKCDKCGRTTHRIVCPECHNILPESTIKGTDMIISIVGARDTGKSHFVAVIINELMKRVAVKLDGSMTGFDDTMTRYKSSFYQKLYVDLQKLEQTNKSTQDVNNGAYRPLIFTLKLRHKFLFKEVIDSFTLVFFDTAGEDLTDLSTMNNVNRYIYNSAGIIFLLDPMKIKEVENQVDDSIRRGAATVGSEQVDSSGEVMARVSEMIRKQNHMKETAKIDIPVAAVFSKLDAIAQLIPAGSTILEPSPHCDKGGYVDADRSQVHEEIKSLLVEWGEEPFVNDVDLNYSNYSFFGISALGLENNPQGDRIQRPRPHRIEDPLLWILKENNVVKSAK